MFKTKNFVKIVGLTALFVNTPCIVSCTKNENIIPPFQCDMNVSPEHSFGFSNPTLFQNPYVDFIVDIDGTLKNGDVIEPVITKQTCEGEVGQYIAIDPNFFRIKINEDTKQVSVRITKDTSCKDDIFWAKFSLKVSLVRDFETIYFEQFDNLSFVNATPTPAEMFATHTEQNQTILDGWSSQPWVETYIKYCNILYIPPEINVIKKQAFFDKFSSKSLIPDNIKMLYLDSTLQTEGLEKNLSLIQEEAFANAPFKQILMPNSITNMETNVFKDNYSLRIIDVSDFQSIPAWQGEHFFEGLDELSIDEGIVYIHTFAMKNDWIQFFEQKEGQNHPILSWKYEDFNK